MFAFGDKIKSKSPVVLSPLAKKIAEMKHVRWVCRFVVLLVTAMSIGGNSINADWGDWISVAIDVSPPILVWGGFEIITRAPLRSGPWYSVKRMARPVAASLITLISMVLSYFNQHSAFAKHTNPDTLTGILTPYMLPLAIDLLMVIAMITLVDLNLSIKELVVLQEAGTVQEARRAESQAVAPVQARSPRKQTKTEKVVKHITKFPEMTNSDIARALGVSASHVGNVRKGMNGKVLTEVAS